MLVQSWQSNVSQTVLLQYMLLAQEQVPPQPSAMLQRPAGQTGTQTHCWSTQLSPRALQLLQGAPPLPQAELCVPARHCWSAAQQPSAQDWEVQRQLPLTQVCPAGQAPLAQLPPQPSSAPQALPAQVGWQQAKFLQSPPVAVQSTRRAPPWPQ